MTKLLVVTRYQEDISWVDRTGWRCVIYNKGPALGRPCIDVPNVGRDTETILRFVLEFYHCLPDLTAFAQGNPFPHCPDFIERLVSATGYTEFCPHRVDERNHPDFMGRRRNVAALMRKMDMVVPEHFEFVKGMQYAVPKEMLTSKSFRWWLNVYSECATWYDERPWHYEMFWPQIWKLELGRTV